ncbi:LuxR C-terminal-related transcriptional regulator [Streptomyces sp. NBC_00347]|uniref:ATP-binding protein n=1 Tax=Streptomyces sp. NBC_00347 TaxID=2975721 RepID=UPI0022588789|nr:LuxR C-terminal-related transcriptional regulator [Streptomyces sp. NBC_00347]MCX5126764.1 LuxR C-terminal-related transcriptional regulator [Streptomyces sp. NBC_00347]
MVTRWGDADLPVELTSFVGRRQEVGAVKRVLSEARVVTLTGVGGVGKTRLAVRVAGELRRAFADGVCFVDLSSVLDPAALESSVAESLRICDQSARGTSEIIAEFLRERQMLLVLDNCEQIADACGVLINAVIREAPRVRVLATSRERLWVTGEYVWRVPSLPVPRAVDASESERGSSTPAEYPALALFAERAAAVSGVSVVREDWGDVARLCHRLDGLPLAIELAAVQTRMFSPGQLVRRFDDRLGSIGTLDRAAPARHRTLEAAIDWSYELCSPQERLLWARASVFAGRFGLEAAEGVCSGEDLPREQVLEGIVGLVDKSVLVHEEQQGEGQYRLLETLAQYGRDRLRQAGAEEQLVRRHRDWFVQWAEELATRWFSAEQLSCSQRLHREYPNLRAAMEYCLSTPGEEQMGLRFNAALIPYWHTGGQLTEARRWLERALAADEEPTPARVMSLRNLGKICTGQYDFAAAEAVLRECGTLARQLQDPFMEACAITSEAGLALVRGDYAAGLAHAENALTIPEYAGRPERVETVSYMAVAHGMLGDYEAALRDYEAAQRCSAESGERYHLSWALQGQICAEFGVGANTAVIEHSREAMRIWREFNDAVGLSPAMTLVLCSTAAMGDFARSAVLVGARERIRRAFGLSFAHKDESAVIEAFVSQMREALGEAPYEAAVARGLSFDLDAALDYALGTEAPPEPATAQEESSPLTARERQVAALVAQGMSNKQIAAELVLSPRTVEGHVEHILTKLGFTSRANIAAWAAQQGN